ncbi:MAG: helix-turn-helix transcriptional regulator [Pseudomonadota bacterium]
MSTITPLTQDPPAAADVSATTRQTLSFAALLREWRTYRRFSQLQLAVESGISQRHISFLETGKAQPSRKTVLELSQTLNVPLRERNALLQQAGFSATYADVPLEQAQLGLFREALEQMLTQHEPYPALMLDGRWRLVGANPAALSFFSRFLDPAQLLPAGGDSAAAPFSIVELCLAEDGLKPYFENWQEVAYSFLQRARAALLANPKDAGMAALIERLCSHPEAPARWQVPAWTSPPPPALTLRLHKDGERFALFTMLAHFGTPQHTVAEDLSVELLFPADEATRSVLRGD